MHGFTRSAVLAAALVAGCSGSVDVGEGTYPVELFLGVGARQSSLQMDECTTVQLGAYLRFDGDAPQVGDYTLRSAFVSSDPATVFVGDGLGLSPDGKVYGAGVIVALKPGLATISASYLGFASTIAVQVEELSGLRIYPVLTDIAQDLPQKFDLIARFSQVRPEQDVSDVASWSFEPATARAAVDAGGEVQANSSRDAESVTLVARLPECGRTAQQSFRVSPIESVELDYEFPDEARLPLGFSEVLRLYARFAAAGATRQNVSRSAELKDIPDDYISAGVVTDTPPTNLSELLDPVDVGEDLLLVRALEDPGVAAFDLHVRSGAGIDLHTRSWSLIDVRLDQLRVTPEELNLRYPDRRALRATGRFTNGMSRDVSREVTWTSLNTSAAAVSSQVDEAGAVEAANTDVDVEIEASLDVDGTVHTDYALVHVFSADSGTPSSDP